MSIYIPDVLLPEQQLKQWVARNGDKVPLGLHQKPIDITNSANLHTFIDVHNAIHNKPELGVGFVLKRPYVGIDLDTYKTQDHTIRELHRRIHDELFPNTYSELSPSGGVHILCKGSIPDVRKLSQIHLEIYDEDRYLTVTGTFLHNLPITDSQASINTLFRYLDATFPAPSPQSTGIVDGPQRQSDEDVWNAAAHAKNGQLFRQLFFGDWQQSCSSQSEADLALCNIVAFYTDNVEQVVRLFHNSALGKRQKAYRHTYLYSPKYGIITKAFDQKQKHHPIPAPMTEHAFIGLAGDVVREIEPHSEASREGLLLSLLGEFGSMVGRGPYVVTDGAYQRAKLSIILVGSSGSGRKGTATRNISRLIKKVDPKFWKEHKATGLSTGEGLIQKIRDTDSPHQDQRLLVVEEEFSNVLSHTKREGNNISACLRLAWDSDEPLQTLAKHNTDISSHHHVSIIAHITDDELKRHLNETEQCNGFANRFLFVRVERSKELPFGGMLDKNQENSLVHRLTQAMVNAHHAEEMTWDEEAQQLWVKNYHDLSTRRNDVCGILTHVQHHRLCDWLCYMHCWTPNQR